MTKEEFIEKYNIILNDQQLSAVESISRPTLVLAVPGSGKTTVLVARTGYMILKEGIDPDKIMTITYTKAAANDMKERFISIFGEENAKGLEFRTINSLALLILNWYSRKIGKKLFNVDNDSKETNFYLRQRFLKLTGSYPTEADISTLKTMITYIKNSMLSPEEQREYIRKQFDGFEDIDNEPVLFILYNDYNKYLRDHSLMDFDDQVYYAFNILSSDHDALSYWRKHYPYISVDEAQDTSLLQHALIALLSSGQNILTGERLDPEPEDHIFMVGDEDQSIYSFRAAWPEALLNFEKDHENATVLYMEKNYRSSQAVIAGANRVIKLNKKRRDKNMTGERKKRGRLREIKLRSRRAEVSYLIKVAEGQLDKESTTAVLARDNESLIPLIDRLERENIAYSYRSRDLAGFFGSHIVRDICDIIAFAENPYDPELFMKIYYKIRTFLTRQQAQALAEERSGRTAESGGILGIADSMPLLKTSTKKACHEARENLSKLLKLNGKAGISLILKDLGYMSYLKRLNADTKKIYAINQIADGLDAAEKLPQRLDELRERISDSERENNSNFILSTIHSSKGLEYDTVFLMDVLDGIFPGTDSDIEEERRLFYVGVTRARDYLDIFSVEKMDSQFIRELFGEEKKEKFDDFETMLKKKREVVFDKEAFEAFKDRLIVGRTVNHKKLGCGVITSLTDEKITIRFESGEKKFMLKNLFQQGLLI